MQALVYTAPNVVELHDQPVPVAAEGEVLLKVSAAGICGSDVDGYLGHSRKRKPPLVMGHEFVGALTEDFPRLGLTAGEEVAILPLLGCGKCKFCDKGQTNLCPDRFLVGMDRPGAFAEYVTVPERAIYRMPEGASRAAGIMAEPLANGWHVVGLLADTVPETAVVIGCGAIGIVVTLALKAHGVKKIIALDTNPQKFDNIRLAGADDTLNARSEAIADEVMALAGAPELIVDCIGVASSRALAIQVAGIQGTLIWIGLNSGEMAGEARDITTKELTIKGSYGYNAQDFEKALDSLPRFNTQLEKVVIYEPLSKGADIFHQLVHQPGETVKAALVP